MTAAAGSVWGYRPPPDAWDESLAADGVPRPASAPALAALRGHAPADIASAVRASVAAEGCVFHSVDGDREFIVDAVPRVIAAGEWDALARGLGQRIRALNAFVADVHGERRIFAEGIVPGRLLEGDHEPGMRHVAVPAGVWTAVCGEDIVREPSGRLVVLEDNLTTPSGSAYAAAARRAVSAHVRTDGERPRSIDALPELLLGALRAVAPGDGDPFIVVLTDGPQNAAHWEHQWLADAMDVPLVTPDELTLSGDELRLGRATVDVVYRRTDRDRLDDSVGRLLGPPLRAGTLGVANAYGTSVADDKLTHAYVAEMVRFYLGEEPLLAQVETLDLGRADHLERALDSLDRLVVKPRRGHGGIGVVIGADTTPAELDALREQLRADPAAYVAQPLVRISRHPTIVGDRVRPRHIDLRPFVFLHGPDDPRVLPGGLTRVALDEGSLIVNSTQNGGAKDTWVL